MWIAVNKIDQIANTLPSLSLVAYTCTLDSRASKETGGW